jgi:predicted alpha/beta superfamily hydrolase
MRSRLRILAVFVLAATMCGCGNAPDSPNENAWHFTPGDVRPLSVSSFRQGRPCWVYLPPNYAYDNRRYPVLYLTDGQAVFVGMHVDRVCEELIRRGEIEPLIVVAVTEPSWNTRVTDLTPPWYEPDYPAGGGGDLFLRAIRDTLMPEVNRRYRTLTGPHHTAIGGVSLGGLLAAYAGFAFDSTFGKVAAFSPSYWYGLTTNIRIYALAKGRPVHLERIYEDTGDPHLDNWIIPMEKVLLSLGFVMDRDLKSAVVPGADHAEGAWERRYPQMLRFLFPAESP